jgi:hypothetical protein
MEIEPENDDETIEFVFAPKTKVTIDLFSALDDASIPYERTDGTVFHYAEGSVGYAMAAVVFSVSILIKNIKPILDSLNEYVNNHRIEITVKTKSGTVHYKVANQSDLDAAIKATLKLRKAEEGKPPAKQLPEEKRP